MKKQLFMTIVFMTASLSNTPTFAVTPTSHIAGVTIQSGASAQAQRNKELVTSMYQWLEKACADRDLLTEDQMAKYFSKDVHYATNDEFTTVTREQLRNHFADILNNVKSIHVLFPLKNLIATDNRAAYHYQLRVIYKDNVHYTDDIAVILKIKDDKIVSWQSVVVHHA